MNNEPLYEGIPLRAHRFVLQDAYWAKLTDEQRERQFPRTSRFLQRAWAGDTLPDPPETN